MTDSDWPGAGPGLTLHSHVFYMCSPLQGLFTYGITIFPITMTGAVVWTALKTVNRFFQGWDYVVPPFKRLFC